LLPPLPSASAWASARVPFLLLFAVGAASAGGCIATLLDRVRVATEPTNGAAE
jgi:hypothetical protein